MTKSMIAIFALASTMAVACKKSDQGESSGATKPTQAPALTGAATESATPGAAKAAESGWRSIPNATEKLQIDAAAKWLDNGMGGAAGMHIEGGADFMIRAMDPDDAAKKIAEVKTDAEQMLFQKWLTAEDKDGVIKLIYNIDKITMKVDEPVKDGSNVAFEVRRELGGKKYKCYGSAPDQASAKEAVDLCSRIKPAN
jgi:hypothetical protein